MSTPYFEYESDALPELEGIYESEWEGESEATFESEQFFQELSQAARRGAPLSSLQRLAMASARAALSAGGAPDAFDGAHFMGQSEYEYEGSFETGYEGESEVQMEQALHYMQQVPSAALMEHLGHAAAEAETEGESFAFLAPLIPLAMKALPLAAKGLGLAAKKMIPKLASNVMRNAPNMVRSLQGVARTLRSNPRTRPLVRTLPTVARRATADLTRMAARGRPVTPQTAAQAVARQTARVIGSPQQAVRAFQDSSALDKSFHQAAGNAVPPSADVASGGMADGMGAMANGAMPADIMSPDTMSAGMGTPGTQGGKQCCCRCGG
jgi:hypothetical protein